MDEVVGCLYSVRIKGTNDVQVSANSSRKYGISADYPTFDLQMTMTFRDRPYHIFLSLAAAAFLISNIGFEVIARLWIRQSSMGEAVSETLYYSATQPIGTLMLLAPFALLGWMAASLATKKTLGFGILLFIPGAVFLGTIYFYGHMDAEQAMQNSKWTAAALSVGMLPFKSIPVLAIILVARKLMGRKPA